MYEVNFEPFVGKEYYSQSPRILVLGESHYFKEGTEINKDITNVVIRQFAKREDGKRHKFFTIIAKALGSQTTDEAVREFWDKVAFYNYVQTSVGNGPRKRPTGEMFVNSDQAFRETIELLRPDIVVVVGRRLSSHLEFSKKEFGPAFSNLILCNWTHPSTPKYFSFQQAVASIEAAKKQFAG